MKDPAARMRDVDAAFEALAERLEKVRGVIHLGETDEGLRYSIRFAGSTLDVDLAVEMRDDALWLRVTVAIMNEPHHSVTRAEWEHCKDVFVGRDRRAFVVIPKRTHATHPHAVTLWAPLERDPLPDFGEEEVGGHLTVA